MGSDTCEADKGYVQQGRDVSTQLPRAIDIDEVKLTSMFRHRAGPRRAGTWDTDTCKSHIFGFSPSDGGSAHLSKSSCPADLFAEAKRGRSDLKVSTAVRAPISKPHAAKTRMSAGPPTPENNGALAGLLVDVA